MVQPGFAFWSAGLDCAGSHKFKSSVVRRPCAFRLTGRFKPCVLADFVPSEGLLLPARRARFLELYAFFRASMEFPGTRGP